MGVFYDAHGDDGVCMGYGPLYPTRNPLGRFAKDGFWTCTLPWIWDKASFFEGTWRIHDRIHRVGANKSFYQTSWFCLELKVKIKILIYTLQHNIKHLFKFSIEN